MRRLPIMAKNRAGLRLIESDSQAEDDPKIQIMTDFSLKVPKYFALINQFKAWFAVAETQEVAHAE